MDLQPILTPENYDGIVGALTGNGELCTTVCPSGYHAPPKQREDIAHATQHFVMAGRRHLNARHPLVNFGVIYRSLFINGSLVSPNTLRQEIEFKNGVVISQWDYEGLQETTRSFVALKDNLFLADTTLENIGDIPVNLEFRVHYEIEVCERNLAEPVRHVLANVHHVEIAVASLHFQPCRFIDRAPPGIYFPAALVGISECPVRQRWHPNRSPRHRRATDWC